MDQAPLTSLLSAYAPLPEYQRDAWLNQARTITLQPEEILLAAQETASSIYVVAQGLLRAVYITPQGKEYSKEFYWCRDTILCLPSLLEKAPLPYALQACEKASVHALPMQTYHELIAESPQWQQFHIKQLERHILFKETKEALLLMHSAEEKVSKVCQLFPDFVRRVPAVMLATYVGITPESLSRIKKRLRL